MKKFLVITLAALFLAPAAAAAERLASLRQLQDVILYHSPDSLVTRSYTIEVTGTVTELHWCGASNHYQMTLLVDDQPDALKAIGAEGPQIIVHFRLNREELPCAVGDAITVTGELNSMYSSVMIPWILAATINGSDDF